MAQLVSFFFIYLLIVLSFNFASRFAYTSFSLDDDFFFIYSMSLAWKRKYYFLYNISTGRINEE